MVFYHSNGKSTNTLAMVNSVTTYLPGAHSAFVPRTPLDFSYCTTPTFLVIATEFQSISTATQSSLVPGEDTSGMLFQSLQLWHIKWAAELDQGILGTQQETYSFTSTIIKPAPYALELEGEHDTRMLEFILRLS